MTDLTLDPDRDLLLDRVVDAPADAIYRAWTEPDRLMPWFCPRPWRVTAATIDPRPGGVFHTVMEGPDGARVDGAPGCVLEAVPGRRLVWTDALGPGFRPNPEPFFTGMVLLDPLPDGRTRYRAVARHATADGAARHAAMGFEAGWGAALDQLLEHLRDSPGGPPAQRRTGETS